MIEPLELAVRGARVLLREVEPRDLDALVRYWHESPPEQLVSLGVDLARVGPPEATRARFAAGIGAPPGRDAMTVVAELEGELAAYVHAHVVEPGTAVGHFHALQPKPVVLAATFELFAPVCDAIIAELGLARLRFNAAPENAGINRLLQAFGVPARRVRIERPDGVGRAGEFLVYELVAGAVPTRPVAVPRAPA